MADGDAYYWAGGRRIPLAASTDVVIDTESAAGARPELARIRDSGRRLSPSLVLVPRVDALAALGEGGDSAPGVHPVYRSEDGSLVVVLPEVRVEASDPARLAALGRSLTTASIKEQTDERLVLEPHSGRGEDALTLANALAESADADVSQARFLRIVPRPGPRR